MSDLNLHPSSASTHRHELRQDQIVTAYAKSWSFFDQNRTLIYGILGGLVVLAAALVGYAIYKQNQNEQALTLLTTPVQTYEAGQFREALDGTQGKPGLLSIADDYGGTDAGNLARFYAANAAYQLGEFDRALELFQAYDKEQNLIGASALAGEAAVYENKKEYGRAADLYRRAADYFENDLTSPQYLLNAGRAYELAQQYDEALETFREIEENYSESVVAAELDAHLARVQAKQGTAS